MRRWRRYLRKPKRPPVRESMSCLKHPHTLTARLSIRSGWGRRVNGFTNSGLPDGLCMSLEKYRSKRDFKATSEPSGKTGKARLQKLAFVIQKHQASHLHYDFRLEWKGVLLSWAVPKGPSLDPSVKRLAMAVEDHPLEYGSFEGTIPEGQYGGGTVMLWDHGTWEPEDPDVDSSLLAGELKFALHG